MAILHHLFQISPVIFAIIAAVLSSIKFSTDRRKSDRLIMLMTVTASILLIIAQTSWWSTYLIENSLRGTWFANIVWTIFNNLVMVIFIMLSRPLR